MTDREKLDLQREAAWKVLHGYQNWLSDAAIGQIIDTVFPLPEPEPETVKAFGSWYRMVDGHLEMEIVPHGGWIPKEDAEDHFLAVAALIQKHRDREWVKAHPDGVPTADVVLKVDEEGRGVRMESQAGANLGFWLRDTVRTAARMLNGVLP